MQNPEVYDVIIVGGGHAGTEAALAAARMGVQTLLLTQNIETLGQMSCNPSIGGIGKGHLVREIDALGGHIARGADRCGIHFRTLNASKGPAVRATRAQIDRALYKTYTRSVLENQENLTIFQQAVEDLTIRNERVLGVVTQMGLSFRAPVVVLTVGTFLGGQIHIGESHFGGGRAGDPPANTLAQRLRELPIRVGRLKTGTPPRIDGRTVDFELLDIQPGDEPCPVFSFMGSAEQHPRQIPCHLAYTSPVTHQKIRAGLDRSPVFSGAIEGVGPRYCPSIEDKVVRFSDKPKHQIFVEPEGLETNEIYPNGISTSLPYDVQLEFVRTIKGFERAQITRPGYAIEYDYFDPRDITPWLETKQIAGLFFAGQINGTTGYEEAAAQGLLAGINAALRIRGEAIWYPQRNEAYIGVLVDDLVTRGTSEPYRMFTSRAEYRLLLREDNADQRLTPIGKQLGLVSEQQWRRFQVKLEALDRERIRLDQIWITPESLSSEISIRVLGQRLRKGQRLSDLLRRPEVDYEGLMCLPDAGPGIADKGVVEQLENEARYSGYIERQQEEIERNRTNEEMQIPSRFDYRLVRGLSTEVLQKLSEHQPVTVGQAARIAGVTPVAVSMLVIFLKKYNADLSKTA